MDTGYIIILKKFLTRLLNIDGYCFLLPLPPLRDFTLETHPCKTCGVPYDRAGIKKR